jgi:hypothetical protein
LYKKNKEHNTGPEGDQGRDKSQHRHQLAEDVRPRREQNHNREHQLKNPRHWKIQWVSPMRNGSAHAHRSS